MKLVAAALGIVVGASLVGCAGAPKAPMPKSTFELAQDELSHTIAETTLTSAGVEAKRPPPAPTDSDRPTPTTSTVVQTWSTPATDDPDLAKNPYDPE